MYTKHGWCFPDEDTHFAEMLDKNIAKGNEPVYQEPVRRKSLQFVEKKGVALDIGANIGLWSRDLCDQFDKVIAFEPVPQFRTCLLENVKKHNLEIRPWALGEEDTHIKMVVTEGNTGHSHVDSNSVGDGDTPMYRLDSLAFDRIDYVKIDCEGYELNILRGAERTFRTFKPIVVVEQKLHEDTGITEHTQFGAADLLKSWGARELARVRHDVILGW
jgi:FkbM family methyltransferase